MEANTDLGQHFMTDEKLLLRIITEARIQENEVVLEIGPGPGALTQLLEKQTKNLITVDVDKRFKATHHANILDIIEGLTFESIVSNLPYHICEPLFIKLLALTPQKITVVVGEKFANHLVKETILGTIFRELYTVKIITDIAPESFTPPPNVTSALITCEKIAEFGKLTDFYQFSKSKVKNYLKTKSPTKREAQEFINKLSVLIQEKRLYELNTKEFLELKEVILTM